MPLDLGYANDVALFDEKEAGSQLQTDNHLDNKKNKVAVRAQASESLRNNGGGSKGRKAEI